MSAQKLALIHGLMVLPESTYGTLPSFNVATDGVQPVEEPQITINYASDGARPAPPGTLGRQRRAAPSGRTASLTLAVEAKGLGAAYTGSAFPPNVDALFRAAGLARTFSTGTHTYATSDAVTGLTSAAAQVFAAGERYDLRGGYCTFGFEATTGQPGRFTFEGQFLCNTPVDDASTPGTIVYPALAVDPPKCENIQLTIGSFTAAVVRSVRYTHGREIGPRVNLNAANGHAGFAPGRREPLWEVVVEATSLVGAPFHTTAGLNPYEMLAPASGAPVGVGISAQMGGTTQNRYRLASTSAQLIGATPGTDGPVRTWTLQLAPHNAGDFSILWD